MNDLKNKKYNTAEKIILFTGVLLIILSFISELNFHYIQGFMPDLIEAEIFWRAEMAEVFNSMSFLILGIILIMLAIIISKKRLKN